MTSRVRCRGGAGVAPSVHARSPWNGEVCSAPSSTPKLNIWLKRCPKVLFLSATPPEEVRAKARPDLIAAGYVKKPFHLDALNKVVTDVLAA